MPIGYSKEPPLRAFVVAKIKKENAEKSIKLYKQKFNQYFYQYEYLKLIRPSKDKEFVELLFCLPEDLEKMKDGFEVEEFFEALLPSIAPIHKEQKPIYDTYWNITHPAYEYPHKQFKDAVTKMQQVIDTKTSRNKCILVDDNDHIHFEAEDECNINACRHCVMVVMEKLAEQNKQADNQINFLQKQYYAKELTLFIYYEPCIMCAMALVHSRIKEVYYYQRRASDGGLNSQLQINNMKQLNHRYQVYYAKAN